MSKLWFWVQRGMCRLRRQSLWVDAERGNDANPGTPRQPLRTLGELHRRLSGTSLGGDLSVHLRGNFAPEPLTLNVRVKRAAVVSVTGNAAVAGGDTRLEVQ